MRRKLALCGLLGVVVLVILAGGCCNHPGVFGKVEQSLKLAQECYEPLLRQDLQEERVHRAVVAADTTLLLAGQLQQMWCPSPGAVEQLQIQSQEMQKLIGETGVKPEAGPGGK